ncbi:hypothetical protein X749_30540 [Mesorhizobium sp. LNJC391B00]|nr:hypothetical protein X749_30540 [Mesorhizobium sp. LNJC391B00]
MANFRARTERQPLKKMNASPRFWRRCPWSATCVCIGRTATCTLSINAGTIASNDLDARIAFQP